LHLEIFSNKKLPTLLIILFVVQGIIYLGMFPLWDPWDEPVHFSYIQHLVEEKSLPTLQDYLSTEITSSFYQFPMPVNWLDTWEQADQTKNFQFHNFTTFWNTFDLNEIQKNKDVIETQPVESRTIYEPFIHVYEGSYPPVGWLPQVPVYLMFYDHDIITRVFALRIFSLMVTTVAVVVAYKTISLLFDDRFMRIGSLMFLVFNPMYMTTLSRVTNETVTILLFSIFLYLMVLYLKGKTNTLHVVLIGVVLGLGILTKPTFIPAILLVPVFIFLKQIQINKDKLRINLSQSLKNLGIIFAITISMGSWWYAKNIASGNPTGHIWMSLEGISFNQFIQGTFQVPWDAFVVEFFRTFWGIYGMSLFSQPDLYFQIIMIMVGISSAGLGYGIALKLKHRGRKIVRDWRYQSIFAVALSTIFIILAQSLFSVHLFLLFKSTLPYGWLTFISFTAIAMLLLLGYRTLINNKLKRFKERSLLAAFIILIIFNVTTFYSLVPKYYAGV